MKKIILCVTTILVCSPVWAFDCTKAFLPVDFVICSSSEAMLANENHEKMYFSIREGLDKVQKKVLLDNQRNWLKTFPIKCGISATGKSPATISSESQQCVIAELSLRTEFLQNYPNLLNSSSDKINSIPSIQSFQSTNKTELKNLQNELEISRTSKFDEYNSAINQIQQSAIFNKANSDMLEVIERISGVIVNWKGRIKSITTSHGGVDARVSIVSTNNVIYRTDSDIQSGTKIYNQLSSLREGQQVKFSGKMTHGGSRGYERSLSERGSLREPEFYVIFDSIEPN